MVCVTNTQKKKDFRTSGTRSDVTWTDTLTRCTSSDNNTIPESSFTSDPRVLGVLSSLRRRGSSTVFCEYFFDGQLASASSLKSDDPRTMGSFQSPPQTTCEGDGDVVGVVTPLRGVAQVVLHGVQVVEVGVRLRVHQDRGVEEDGEGQVEVEREEVEVRERRSCVKMG